MIFLVQFLSKHTDIVLHFNCLLLFYPSFLSFAVTDIGSTLHFSNRWERSSELYPRNRIPASQDFGILRPTSKGLPETLLNLYILWKKWFSGSLPMNLLPANELVSSFPSSKRHCVKMLLSHISHVPSRCCGSSQVLETPDTYQLELRLPRLLFWPLSLLLGCIY